MRRFSAVLFVLIFPIVAHAATFTVNSTADAPDANAGDSVCATSGSVCTLRAAIQEANALAGTDSIFFSIGSGVQTIAPASDLPAITGTIVIDATTQPPGGSTPRIVIDGANVRTVGIDVNNASAAIYGLDIIRFTTAGIRTLQSGDVVQVLRCYIGVATDGVTPMGNGDGIWAKISDLNGSSLLVGDATGLGNVISGNADMAIELNDNGGAGAKLGTFTLQGNIIGLGADGMTAVPNASGGIRTNLQFGSITVGGSPTARNILSGNGGNGFAAAGFLQADTMTVTNNYVGVASDGITARGNNGIGLSLVARVYTVAKNIVAENPNDGITIATGTGPSVIRNNRIGVALDG
ncbi:MAG: CSLREA domain-containing protein, partial [Thermoanaerobaculia bacterium]